MEKMDMLWLLELDEKLLEKLSKTHDVFVTVEDNVVAGGAGSSVNEYVLANDLNVRVKNLGLPDKFTTHGTRDEVLDEAGLSEEKIMKFISKL